MKINKTFLVFVVLSYIFAYLSGKNLPYAVFYCFLIGLITSIIYIFSNYRAINAKLFFEKTNFETGDKADFNIIVLNQSLLPQYCVLVLSKAYCEFNKLHKGYAINLRYNDEKWVKYSVNFSLRGVYDFGRVTLNMRDFLSVFEMTKVIDTSKLIKVYPKIHELSDIYISGREDSEAPANKKGNIEDLSTVDDIRKYRIGDSLKRIHWKVSAKHGELFTKSFDTLTGQDCHILLDMNKISYFMEDAEIVEEQLIEFFISFLNYMIKRGVESKILIINKKNIRFEVSTADDLRTISEYLINNRSDGDSVLTRYIDSLQNEIERNAWVGIFVPRVNNTIKDSIIELKYIGYEIFVFYVFKDRDCEDNISELKKNGVECVLFENAIK